MLKLTWRQAARWRLRQHHLDRRAPAGSMLAVASRLCGLHAQVLSSAELTAWARVEGLDRRALPEALWEQRTLVKTWAMRGTLHLLPSDELPLWHAALRFNWRYLKPDLWQRYFGVTMEELEQITEAVAGALTGRIVTRDELVTAVVRISGSAAFGAKVAESSWGMLLKPAAFSGRLCFGPSVGQRVRFTHPETWLAESGRAPLSPVDPETVGPEVARRFLTAYSPATFHDLARWWSGSVGLARQWIESLGDEVAPVDLAGTAAWMLAADVRKARELEPVRSVRLLPGFDQYVVEASPHADHLLPGDLRARVYRPQGWISPVLLVNGFLHGVWRHEIKGSRVEVAIHPFVDVPIWVRRAAAQEAERLAAFFGGKLKLTWKS